MTAGNMQKLNEDIVSITSRNYTNLAPRNGAYVKAFLELPYTLLPRGNAGCEKAQINVSRKKPRATLKQSTTTQGAFIRQQATKEQHEVAEMAMSYLVEDLSVRLGRPAIWCDFKNDSEVNVSVLKQVFGYPVSIEATLAARFSQYLTQHPEIAKSIEQRPLQQKTTRSSKQKSPNGVYSAQYSTQRVKNIQAQRSLFKGKSDQLDEKAMAELIEHLSEQPWAGMIKYDDHGFRSYHLDCADFLLGILSDVTEAMGDFPSLSTWRELARSPLDLPTRGNLMQVLGPIDTWQTKMTNYRQRKLEHPETIERPRSTSRVRKNVADIERLLQGCSWVEQMKNRSRYSVKASDLSTDLCMEIMSDIIEANDGFLPNDIVLRDLNYRMNTPAAQTFKPRIGLKKTWKESITAWRVANHPDRDYIPIQ